MNTRSLSMPLKYKGLNTRPVYISGVAFTVLGVLAIVLPQVATLATVLFIGWLLLVAGVIGLYVAIQVRELFNWRSMALLFAFTGITGLFMLAYPDTGSRLLTAMLAALLLLEGAVFTAMGIAFRDALVARKWVLASGLMSFVLAVLILIEWPTSTTIVIGLLVGINFLTNGLSLFFLGSAIKRLT